jgi:hypothetical protein
LKKFDNFDMFKQYKGIENGLKLRDMMILAATSVIQYMQASPKALQRLTEGASDMSKRALANSESSALTASFKVSRGSSKARKIRNLVNFAAP